MGGERRKAPAAHSGLSGTMPCMWSQRPVPGVVISGH